MLNKTLLALILLSGFQPTAPGDKTAIAGIVATERDPAAFLPGAEVTLLRIAGETDEAVATTVSDAGGAFRFDDLQPGTYRLRALLSGFRDQITPPLQAAAGQELRVDLLLSVGQLEENVEVVAETQQDIPVTGTSEETLKGSLVDLAPVKGDDFQSLLPLLPGVVRAADGRINMKGGGATQSSLVVNSSSNVTDPATGNYGFNLPSDAIETLDVLPNPYAAEYGRFSSGVTNILTRQGTNKWKYTINNFLPRPKVRDGSILGIGGFTPRLGARGPLVEDRLFLAQTVQYRYLITRIPGQPVLVNDTRLESFDSFTQLDANLNETNTLTGIVAVFPRKLDFVNLDTFNPLEVTANFHQRGYNFGLSERAVFSPRAVLESTVSYKRYDVDVFGQGLGEMFLAPDGNTGNFFNLQRRRTKTLQWVENLSYLAADWGGEHLFKFGVDVLHSSFDGLSESRAVNILRADGSLGSRIEYSRPASQRERATDLAFYAQDRWRINDRVLLELGGRFDRDGVLSRSHFSPRFGFVIGVLPDGSGFLRGGAGLFYDRTPLSVGAFENYESPIVTRFEPDGETVLGDPVPFALHSNPDLTTPYSFTWNLEYDQRLTNRLLLKTNFLRRAGFHEFLVDPVAGTDPTLRLDTRGRSRYWELEVTGRYNLQEDSHLIFSYVRSESKKDLNAFDNYFGNFRNPIIRPNEYSLADTDTPHRFIFQGTVIMPGKWIVSPVVEWRSGFPYSTIDENRDFVGPRNRAGRFPNLITLDLDVQRWFKISKWNTRIGFRIFNLFNTFNPRDVQGNIDSTNFGVFSNTVLRLFGGTFQIEY